MSDSETLKLFGEDYSQAELILVYGRNVKRDYAGIQVLPAQDFFATAESLLH